MNSSLRIPPRCSVSLVPTNRSALFSNQTHAMEKNELKIPAIARVAAADSDAVSSASDFESDAEWDAEEEETSAVEEKVRAKFAEKRAKLDTELTRAIKLLANAIKHMAEMQEALATSDSDETADDKARGTDPKTPNGEHRQEKEEVAPLTDKERYTALKQAGRKVRELRIAVNGPLDLGKHDFFQVIVNGKSTRFEKNS